MPTWAEPDTPADDAKNQAQEDHYRAIALEHAKSLEAKKNLQLKVLDTIIAAFDLPNDQITTSANPTESDAKAFRDYLFLFRPDDLDEVISERNIDNSCGYALCRNEIQQPKNTRRYDERTGQMVEERPGIYCSIACKQRTMFVRKQLSDEPAWLRYGKDVHIRLQTDSQERPAPTINDRAIQEALATERGDSKESRSDNFTIVEKDTTSMPEPPKADISITVGDVLEGLPVRTIGKRKDLT